MAAIINDHQNNQYSPPAGHMLLRSEICKWWSPHFNGRTLDPNSNVLITNGAIGAIYAVINNLVS